MRNRRIVFEFREPGRVIDGDLELVKPPDATGVSRYGG